MAGLRNHQTHRDAEGYAGHKALGQYLLYERLSDCTLPMILTSLCIFEEVLNH